MITEVMQPDYYPIVSQLTAIGQFDNGRDWGYSIDTPVPVKLFLGKKIFPFLRYLLAGEWLDDLSTYERHHYHRITGAPNGMEPTRAIGKHIIQSYITYTLST